MIIRHYCSRGTGFDPAIAGMQFFSGRVVFIPFCDINIFKKGAPSLGLRGNNRSFDL